MPDSIVGQLLLSRATRDWSILRDLAAHGEPYRRNLLRFHRERGVSDAEEQVLRQRVDDALEGLTLLEAGVEVGLLTEAEADFASIDGLATLLSTSSAFVRYADNYLSLSLRFIAERLQVALPSDQGQLNELPVPRPCPPPVDRVVCRSEHAVSRFLTIEPAGSDPNIALALRFLDDFTTKDLPPGAEHAEVGPEATARTPPSDQIRFELWLRGLSERKATDPYFETIFDGLLSFADLKTDFYLDLECEGPGAVAGVDLAANMVPPSPPTTSPRSTSMARIIGNTDEDRLSVWVGSAGARGGFLASNPITARFGLLDLYWLARLLRADVSPTGTVSYSHTSWLELIAQRMDRDQQHQSAETVRAYEDLLRVVLDYTCDLVQNSVDIVVAYLDATTADGRPSQPGTTVTWRAAFDAELHEIQRQRRDRLGVEPSRRVYGADTPEPASPPPTDDGQPGRPRPGGPGRVGWSRRVRTGEHERELVGLAISGGGIRSATFGLGVLQGLQELDLLRKVDYLSTVSGGGYIGSWLTANVKRSRYWLTQPTQWTASIAHLRRYSNYLAPNSGLFSADTWSMWGTWIRNMVLVQVGAVAWLGVAMAAVTLAGLAFGSGAAPDAVASAVTGGMVLLTLAVLAHTWRQSPSTSEGLVQATVVAPALLGAYLAAAVLWYHAGGVSPDLRYGAALQAGLLLPAVQHVLIVLFACFIALSWCAADRVGAAVRTLLALLGAAVATVLTYAATVALFWAYVNWNATPDITVWFAFAFGPSLLLLAATAGVVAMIGIVGLDSNDWRREWWTRLGSWLGMYAAGSLALSGATIFGPWCLFALFEALGSSEWAGWSGWATVLGWVGTVLGGLLAGNSERSDGRGSTSPIAAAMSIFARVAAVVFIAGALCLVATLVHVLLVKLAIATSAGDYVPIGMAAYWNNLARMTSIGVLSTAAPLLAIAGLSSLRVDLNVFGLNQFYRNRIVRCYLGATRWQPGKRRPHKFTAFDGDDDLPLSHLRQDAPDGIPFRGPFPIVNGALNLGGSPDLSLHTRHSASFVMTPLHCGADRPAVGYAPVKQGDMAFAGGVTLGQAVSISGAAASPNMGYDTSPLVSFLLTMFNVRLAWWFPNPGRHTWSATRLYWGVLYLLNETLGLANETSGFVNVSDGGHFENLGIYELVRRRCTVIIASDGECDSNLTFGSLGRVIRMCRIDFNADIDLDVESIRRMQGSQNSRSHCAVGRITYSNGSIGYLIYLKASLSGDEPVDVQQYRDSHAAFPHESTGDQFFAEDQFESYRKLGHHIAGVTFRGTSDCANVTAMARRLADIWVAESEAAGKFVTQTEALVALWERMRATPGLTALLQELHGTPLGSTASSPRTPDDEQVICLELLQLMENTFLELRLDEHWTHPDNRGWVELFSLWARSATLRAVWNSSRSTYGIRFEHFCRQRLGL